MKDFTPYGLHTVKECLWRRRKDGEDDQDMSLAPKDFAVLKNLVEHTGRVVSQNELLEAL